MVTQTLEDMLVTDAEISGYMEKRDNQEHLKIKNPSEYINDVKEYFSEDLTGGLALPFTKTHTDFRIRSGEVTLCTGYSGHGKSAWLNYVMLHLLQQQKTMIASFEMLPKQTLASEDYARQKEFVNSLCVAARDLGIHIFLVAHSRKTANEDDGSTKMDVSGSSDITNLVDNVLSVHRNKKREREMAEGGIDEKVMNSSPCSVYLLKQRHGQGTETKWGFGYLPKTFQYTETW